MYQLANTPVGIEPSSDTRSARGNSLPILHEIRHRLQHLAESGETSLIDLSSLPFGPGDEERLLRILGEGEVQAKVDALGPTLVRECAIPGVWIVDHRDLQEQRLTLHIEITRIPDILCAQSGELEDAITELDARIAADATVPGT